METTLSSISGKAAENEFSQPKVAILTGGADKPYALGLASALVAEHLTLDFIGSDEIDGPELHGTSQVRFLNLRGDQRVNVGRWRKLLRVFRYYGRLLAYAAASRARIFHILWNNKFETFDRTLLMAYYKLLGKRIVFTAHNVNAGKRDGNDSLLNRLTLKIQYHLADRIFVHSEGMKQELVGDFQIAGQRVTVIPFGINNTLPNTNLSREQARARFALAEHDRVLLFFGNIAPYKGLDCLVTALSSAAVADSNVRLIVAGRPKGCEPYWQEIRRQIEQSGLASRVIEKIDYIPDDQVEAYFKAADAVVLPYRQVFQSGVLFLAYSFGLPVIATDVGAMKEEILVEKTGLVCRAADPHDLATKIASYFTSELYRNLAGRRAEIQAYANERYSWSQVGRATSQLYRELLPG